MLWWCSQVWHRLYTKLTNMLGTNFLAFEILWPLSTLAMCNITWSHDSCEQGYVHSEEDESRVQHGRTEGGASQHSEAAEVRGEVEEHC